jgi:hypothetical protein
MVWIRLHVDATVAARDSTEVAAPRRALTRVTNGAGFAHHAARTTCTRFPFDLYAQTTAQRRNTVSTPRRAHAVVADFSLGAGVVAPSTKARISAGVDTGSATLDWLATIARRTALALDAHVASVTFLAAGAAMALVALKVYAQAIAGVWGISSALSRAATTAARLPVPAIFATSATVRRVHS